MYQRRAAVRRGRRRVRRRRGSRLPLCAFLLAVLSFTLASALPPEESPQPTQPARTVAVRSMASLAELDAPDLSSWSLTLVNQWNPLSRDNTFTPEKLSNGLAVDQRCYPDLQTMMDACRVAGLSPVICSAYRSYEKQEELYWNKVDYLLAQGYAQTDAEEEAGREVARPGTSEHQLGLAVDIVDLDNQNLDETQEDTAVQQWLMAHSWEYGFILRYPGGKSEITGIIYEPWHYRYVGHEDAERIHSLGVCLEEYLEGAS